MWPCATQFCMDGAILIDVMLDNFIQIEMDLYRYLLSNRIIFIGGYINDKASRSAVPLPIGAGGPS